MKRSINRIIGLTGLLLGLSCSQFSMAGDIERPKWVDGEIIIKFKETASPADVQNLVSSLNLKSLHKYRLTSAQHIKLPGNMTVSDAIATLAGSPLVEYVQPNNLYYKNVIPNDTQFGSLWGANNTGQTGGTIDADMDLPEAWDITTGSSSVVVAVIDSGAQLDHPDLAANIWTNPGEIAGNGIDDDGNGYIDDVHGWDFRRNDNDPSPAGGACGGHGTHTAGTIGAVGNNNLGVTGVNWNVQVMPLNTFYTLLGIFCTTQDADLLSAIDYYTMMGVRISSNSYGGGSPSTAMSDAIRASKSLFVAAAGNDASNNDVTPAYPASYPLDNIVSVAATDHNDALASFSNYGATSVDLSGPGVNILSTLPGSTYGFYSGTSMATPNVAGVAALLLSQDQGLTINELKWRILHGTDPIGINVLTQGRANANNSLQYGLSLPTVSMTISPNGSTTAARGSTISYSVTLTNNTGSSQTVTGKTYAQLANGTTVALDGPANLNLGGGASQTFNLSQTIPAGAPLGDVDLYGSAETATSLDEEKIVYTIVP